MGSGKSSQQAQMPPEMRQVIREFWSETGQLRQTVQSQMMEALTTGGVGARMPVIQRAEEAQRRASSQAMRGAETELAQKGLAGTPFAENILAQLNLQGRSAVSAIGPQMAAEWAQGVPGYTLGATQSIMGSLGGTRASTGSAKSWQI